ncbi:DNA-processing protein DprA [Photobacterium leiognathi]|uniref:DNA-processing protein DprA n=1 Tax=Photobacterium leiognathi TaxID=553611 RepID=UPI002981F1BD|nr:DNA-processing protein DprA [Photobacterium leiognathi]
MTSESTKFLLAYRYLKGIGKRYLNELAIAVENTGSPVDVCFNSNKSDAYSQSDIDAALLKAEEQVVIAKNLGHSIISRLDSSYPEALKAVKDAPPILFCSGNLNLLKAPDIVTIIGTRAPTKHGVSIAERVTEWFSNNGWVIASGLAKGVDTIAHQSCLNAGGRTISILAHGLEKIYPAQNKTLAKDIINQDGLLISEYGYNSYVGKSNFVERDRIQAALAKAVILVQSDLDGGSLHASRAIIEYGRYLVVLGQSPRDKFNQEPKITANITLIEGSEQQKSLLLKTHAGNLNRVIYLPDKSYLAEVNKIIRKVYFDTKGGNINLF